jgi:hypothetical protein
VFGGVELMGLLYEIRFYLKIGIASPQDIYRDSLSGLASQAPPPS